MLPSSVAALPSSSAASFGRRTAFHFPQSGGLDSLTYEDLDRRSAALRDHLAPLLQAGEAVILTGQNSIAWAIAFYAIARAGGVPVPLDPEMAGDQLGPVLAELDARAVIADRDLLPRFAAPAVADHAARIALQDVAQLSEGGAAGRPPGEDHHPAPDDLALLVYTAGTTGVPKGVRLTHRNLLANVEGVIDAVEISADDALMLVLPLYHAFSLTVGCLAAVAAGVRVELESRPLRLASRMTEDRPTILVGVPALFETMLRQVRHRTGRGMRGRVFVAALALNRSLIRVTGINAGRLLFRSLHRALGGRLRFAVSGAAALRRETAEEAFLLGIPLIQGYGMSEAGPVISVQRFHARRFWFSRYYWRRIGSVGQPVLGVSVAVEPLPGADDPGIGEILVRGPSVMAGYHRRELETSEALRGGALHTGDVGRIDREGAIWLSGRGKLAISTPQGKLVHLERVESAIASALEVEQVVVCEERDGRWRLSAVVYPAAAALGGVESAEAVLARVRVAVRDSCRHLRGFERPAEIRLSDEPFPTTRLGKVRRDSVPRAASFDLARWRERAAVALASSGAPDGDRGDPGMGARRGRRGRTRVTAAWVGRLLSRARGPR